MKKLVGNFMIDVSDSPYPVWIRLFDKRNDLLFSIRHDELADLHYAIHVADTHARLVLGKDKKEMLKI